MGVLRPVVQILRATVLNPGHESPVRHVVAGQLVSDQHPGHVLEPFE